jgi:hypothetical protein
MTQRQTLVVGPFTWRREDSSNGEECWELVRPEGLTYFCVKNYGGEPNANSGFSGWRLVSGGPFTEAGGWTSRGDAMSGVVPFLIEYYRYQAASRMAEAERLEAAVSAFISKVEGGGT